MPTTQHDEPYIKTLEYVATASWHCHGVPSSTDLAATAFGPPAGFAWSPSGAVAPPLQQVTKQVLYIPVKKQNGQETFPALRIHLGVLEVGWLRNVCVPGHRGAKVELNVWNVWGNQRRGPVKLQGSLDANDECDVVIPPDKVQSWLEPTAELGGRVNELLLDFDFTLPSLKGLKGESSTRVYLYRRKVIVFLPGVFGSQLRVKMPDGRTLGFPDFFADHLELIPGPLNPQYALAKTVLHALYQKVGGLECDASGRPLVEPIKPTLLRLKGTVYDVYDDCRSARMQYFSGVPEAFRLVELQVLAYDWRTDLTECAKELAAKLEALQAHLRSLPDVDDEVALAGHSTGGLIMRRALGEPGMQARVSHAFFISVPFLGAPKALSVILTGQDPPGGEAMIYIVTADSLRDGALSMPIVYHLAPTAAYPERVAFTPSRPAGAPPSIEDQKRDLIETAINAGFRPRPRFVKAGAGSDVDRVLLAASADDWHGFWAEASERMRAQELYDAMYPRGYPERDGWMPEQIKARRLETQYAARVTGGWNAELAARAERFHRESLEIGRSGEWAEKAYVFYSIARAPTTLRVHLERVGETGFGGPIDLLKDEHIPMLRFLDGDVEPPRGEDEQTLSTGEAVPAPTVHQWTRANGECQKVVWRLWGENARNAGDGTVPLKSLVGFGGSARFAPPLAEDSDNTAHKDTPKEGSIWLLIMRSLQGTWAPPPSTAEDALLTIRKSGSP